MVEGTAITPGEGLGGIMKLGSMMYTIVNQLTKHEQKIKIVYSESEYLDTPITVIVQDLGMRLIFENSNKQELILIEVLDFSKLRLLYNGLPLNEILEQVRPASIETNGRVDSLALNTGRLPSSEADEKVLSADSSKENGVTEVETLVVPPNLGDIYNKFFGPTYPGRVSKDYRRYILSYPGIAFKFSIDLDELVAQLKSLDNSNENNIISTLLNWRKQSDLRCISIAIFHGSSWDSFIKSLSSSKNFIKTLAPRKPESPGPQIKSFIVNLKMGVIKIIFETEKDRNEKSEYEIQIGQTTQQEVLNILGPPDDYFNKFDSRLLIHNYLPKSLNLDLNDTSIYKFHNYFKYGLDFLYDLNSSSDMHSAGILTKVIVHNGGITESLDFMKWNKCRWKVFTGKSSDEKNPFNMKDDIVITSSMYFKQIPESFFKALSDDVPRPVFLNRNETEFIDNDLTIIEPEELPCDSLSPFFERTSLNATTTPSVAENKKWGQSKLYGCNRCIMEVVESNGCISSLTIF